MAIFNSYVNAYQRVILHFPMVFLWFSYGFPMVFPLKPPFFTILQPPRQRRLHVLRPRLRRLAPVLLRAEALLRRAQAPRRSPASPWGRGEWEGGNPKKKGIHPWLGYLVITGYIIVINPIYNVDYLYIAGWWFSYPSEKWWSSSVGMMKFPIDGKIKHVQTTNQIRHQSSSIPRHHELWCQPKTTLTKRMV